MPKKDELWAFHVYLLYMININVCLLTGSWPPVILQKWSLGKQVEYPWLNGNVCVYVSVHAHIFGIQQILAAFIAVGVRCHR